MTIKRNLYKACLARISEMDVSPSAVLLVNGQPPRQYPTGDVRCPGMGAAQHVRVPSVDCFSFLLSLLYG